MKETQLQIELPGVPKAKQGREVPPQWEWTEAVVLSPLLANIYLNPLDHQMARQGWQMARYADLGLISLTLTRKQAAKAQA